MSLKAENDHTRVVINRDFSIEIPKGMIYSADKKEIGAQRVLVFVKEEKNETYLKKFDEETACGIDSPYSSPECMVLTEAPPEYGRNLCLEMKDYTKKFLKGHQQKRKMVMESEQLLVCYGISKEQNDCFFIITPSSVYLGQFWMNDMKDMKKAYARIGQWLQTVEKHVVTEEEKVCCQPFKVPTYADGKQARFGSLSVAVPDHFSTMDSLLNGQNSKLSDIGSYRVLADTFEFLMVPDDFAEGFFHYKDAPLSVYCKKEGILDVGPLSMLWGEEKEIREQFLCRLVNTSVEQKGCSGLTPHYFEPDEELAVVYEQFRESSDPDEYWCGYTFAILGKSVMYQPMIYINAQEDKPAFEAFIEDWISRIKWADSEKTDSPEDQQNENELGEYAAEDGKIDAMKVAQLFIHDVVFNLEDEISYDGVHHHMDGLQFNAAVISDYPYILHHLEPIRQEILQMANFVEENENLMVPTSMFREELLDATREEAITGISLFDFCAYHMINISELEENKYMVVLDQYLIRGIPECYKFIAEFIRTLREYNGQFDDFQLTFGSAFVIDSPVEEMEEPAFGAVSQDADTTLNVKGEEHPYAGIVEKLNKLKEN